MLLLVYGVVSQSIVQPWKLFALGGDRVCMTPICRFDTSKLKLQFTGNLRLWIVIRLWNVLIAWVLFSSKLISEHHTFPAGTQRKVTDVYVKEARANHLLPDSTAFAALCLHEDLAPCVAASGLSTVSATYVVDIIDLTELYIMIDKLFEARCP